MSCIISSTCQITDTSEKQYSYYTLSIDGTVGGDLYDTIDSVIALNNNYILKKAFLIHKNENSILDVVNYEDYNTVLNNINYYDITQNITESKTFKNAISKFNNNNKIKDNRTYYVYVYDGKTYQTLGGSDLSQNIIDKFPAGVKYCGLIEYLYDCKSPVSPSTLNNNEGCFLNMDVTDIITNNALPTSFIGFKDQKISTTDVTFSDIFNDFGNEFNQNKLSFGTFVVYFEETPNCLLDSTISIQQFSDYVNDANNNFNVPQVRLCAINTIKNTFNRVNNYVEKMLLYKNLNTTSDGYFLNDKKQIEKRLGKEKLKKVYESEGKYDILVKIINVTLAIVAILMFIFKANKKSAKNYVLLTLCIFMPYIMKYVSLIISKIHRFDIDIKIKPVQQ